MKFKIGVAPQLGLRAGIASIPLFAVILLFASGGFAVGEVRDYSIHQQFISPRALGMGNAFVAIADDYAATLYNPAGLARIKKNQTNLSLLHAGLDTKIPGFYDQIQSVGDTQDIQKMTELLESNYGNHYSARIGLLNAHWVGPNWGFAVIPSDFQLELRVGQLVGPNVEVVATHDTTIAYGRGWDVDLGSAKNGNLSLGVTAKAIYRGYFNKSLSAVDLAFDSNILRGEDAGEGLTIDGDIGLLYSPKFTKRGFWGFLGFAQPNLGVVVRNVVDYGFPMNFRQIDPRSGEPARLERRVDVGSAFQLPDWWIWKTRFALDIRDIGHSNWTFQKGLHAGAEFAWKIRSWWQGGWRIGVNQGYFTAGFNGDFALFRLDLVSYAQEVGTSRTPKSTRIYMLKTSLDF